MIQMETARARIDGYVATIVLERPSVLNCIDPQLLRDLDAIVEALSTTDGLRVVIVRGEGRAFCSGIDLTALAERRIPASFYRDWESLLRKFETRLPPVIAAVHSHCIGGGLQLALACDLRVARDDARFGMTAVAEGIIPGLGMWRLARHAGLGRAKRLALAADIVDAPTALAWGMVDYLASADTFEHTIAGLTNRLLLMAPTSTWFTKKLTHLAFDSSYGDVVEILCDYQRASTASSEHRRAMAEHRKARAARRIDRDDAPENDAADVAGVAP